MSRKYVANSTSNNDLGETRIEYLAHWRVQIAAGVCGTTELRICGHHLSVFDYGETLRLSTEMRRSLGYGDDYEQNRCAIISLAAGLGRLSQTKHRRCMDSKLVLAMALQISDDELRNARDGSTFLQTPATQDGVELRSIAHGAISANHHRDIRTLHFFILESVLGDLDSDCVVIEIDGDETRTFHLYEKESTE